MNPEGSEKSNLWYVVHEMPPTSQTFVWREIEELRRHREVYVWVLNPGDGVPIPPDFSLSIGVVVRYRRYVPRMLSGCLRGLGQILGLVGAQGFSLHSLARQGKALANGMGLALAILGSRRPAHIHAHFLGRTLDAATYAAILVPGTSVSATAHAGDAFRPPEPQRLKSELARTTFVACASAAVRDALSSFGAPCRLDVVHCGVVDRGFGQPLPEGQTLRIWTVARLVEKKGLDTCLHAAKGLVDAGVSFHWKIVGQGPCRDSLASLAESLELGTQVDFIGRLDNAAVLEALKTECDIFILPCRTASDGDVDGIPVALMEAMTFAVPVVTSPVGGITELVVDRKTGFLCPSGDARALTDTIREIASGRAQAVRIAESGRSLVLSEFALETEVAKLLSLLPA